VTAEPRPGARTDAGEGLLASGSERSIPEAEKAEQNLRDLVAKFLSGNWVAPLATRGQRR
jgi:hypothetical protein